MILFYLLLLIEVLQAPAFLKQQTPLQVVTQTSRIYSAISQIEDDGYSVSDKERAGRLFGGIFRTIPLLKKKTPGVLILIRHGESEWNFNNTFTGWVDVDLCDRGRREMEHAARILLASGYDVDVTYTSRLKRAIKSSWILQRESNKIYRPLYKSWRLNERMYGALEGLSKPGIASQLGEDVVQQFRTGLSTRPPPMTPSHPYWHKSERKYADLDPDDIPVTESLQDTMERTLPLWYRRILPDLLSGQNVLVVAHANSLRGIVKHVDGLTDEQIREVAIPNGIPLVYKFDANMNPIMQSSAVSPLTGEFLEKKGLLRDALAKEVELAKFVPGYKLSGIKAAAPLDPLLRSLAFLDLEEKLALLASGNLTVQNPILIPDQPSTESLTPPQYSSSKRPAPILAGEDSAGCGPDNEIPTPVIVIIRHGKTEYNKLGLFTGWEDAPLAEEGREEARAAGRLLKAHGVEFDAVYTSWLSRAIETAWIIMNQLDSLWLPIIKTWRLNERMYGALTGMSKKMIQQKHGDRKYMEWRRGYKNRPPKVSSFSSNYPGNDKRYVDNVQDVRFSIFESLIRSIAHARIELHRKFPRTESLSDCTKRTIPYYKDVIVPGSIAQNKSVLIASSENAIRGLLMHLCEIPEDHIHELEIPTGVPLIYDLKRKRVRLLDDGLLPDPMERYDFGAAGDFLFKPCDGNSSIDRCYFSSSGKVYKCDPLIRLKSIEEYRYLNTNMTSIPVSVDR